MHPYVVIGAGPMGLCTMRRLLDKQLPVIGLEAHSNVGGLWDIDSHTSTMYESAHLISSKKMTEFADFPMDESVAYYPRHDQLKLYFQDYARHFDLYSHYRFNATVVNCEPHEGQWRVTYVQDGIEHHIQASGVILANGTLHQPKRAGFEGAFAGEQIHSSNYKSPAIFDGKRVLIVGCGNSACDIAVDAVHRAKSVDMVVRRGYYFIPKFVKGVPIDTLGGKIRLPNRLKQMVDGWLVRMISGKPSQYGLPDPDYKMYESHPVVNSLFLHHIGHGDITVRPSVKEVRGHTVTFENGKAADYDLILEGTGYVLHYPFIDSKWLNWKGYAPQLYLNMFSPSSDSVFVMGMVEAAGLGWQGRDEQAQVLASLLALKRDYPEKAALWHETVKQCCNERVDGGMNYLNVERMAYYVHKAEYLSALQLAMKQLQTL